MKKLTTLLFLFMTTLVSAQTVNQFDADGKRHGIWKKYFEGTKVLRYEGQFNHGKETGVFKYYKNIDMKASLTATKQFNDTNNKAHVTFYSSQGKVISEGEMDGKAYIGEWKYYHKNSDKIMTLEHYDTEGRLDGEKLVYYENGQVAQKQWYVHGKLDGLYLLYSDKNVVLKEFFYVNGELHGPSKVYNPKGELIVEGDYKHGEKHGIWKYYENGKLTDEKDFTYHKPAGKKP